MSVQAKKGSFVHFGRGGGGILPTDQTDGMFLKIGLISITQVLKCIAS